MSAVSRFAPDLARPGSRRVSRLLSACAAEDSVNPGVARNDPAGVRSYSWVLGPAIRETIGNARCAIQRGSSRSVATSAASRSRRDALFSSSGRNSGTFRTSCGAVTALRGSPGRSGSRVSRDIFGCDRTLADASRACHSRRNSRRSGPYRASCRSPVRSRSRVHAAPALASGSARAPNAERPNSNRTKRAARGVADNGCARVSRGKSLSGYAGSGMDMVPAPASGRALLHAFANP